MSDEFQDDLARAGRRARGAARDLPRNGQSPDPKHYRATGGTRRRLAIAAGRPQALLKVTSYGKGLKSVARHARYITRKGELALETQDGEPIAGRDAMRSLMAEWSETGFGARKNARDTAHIVLGVPPESDRDALSSAVRAFGADAFEGHRFAWVRHDDTQAPHAHLMLHMTREDGRKPHLSIKQFSQWREQFAAHCREHGIEVDASRAWERGRAPRNKTQQVEYHMRQRGERLDKSRQTVAAAQAEQRQPQLPSKPWEQARRDNVRQRQAEFESDADRLERAAHDRPADEASKLHSAAEQLRGFAAAMEVPRTRHQQAQAHLAQRHREQQRAAERGPER